MADVISIALINVLNLLLRLVFAGAVVFLGVKIFDRMTPDLDEMAELKKGNVAVAVLLLGIMTALALSVHGAAADAANQFYIGMNVQVAVLALAIAALRLAWGLLVGIVTILLSISIMDTLTGNVDEIRELRRKNVALAIFMAGILIAISIVVQAGVSGVSNSVSLTPQQLALMMGL